jgi:tRNA nucleotidyltransferase (CCA-adding enzyme)
LSEHPTNLAKQAEKVLGPRWGLLLSAGRHASALGYSAHAIGGIPRDLLLGRPIRDLDITIEGEAAEVAESLAQAKGGQVQIHAAFRTATWTPPDGPPIDMASTRTETYPSAGALPTVSPASLEQDLQRRDFTVNTIALSLDPNEAGMLTTAPHGLDDLENRVLRVLHEKSFQDDPTRVLRAARFATRLELTLHPATQEQLFEAIESGCIQSLGRERLGCELDLIFGEPTVVESLRHLGEWGVFGAIHSLLRADFSWLETALALAATLVHHRDADWSTPGHTDPWWLLLAQRLPPEVRVDLCRLIPGDRHQQAAWLEGPEQVDALARDLDGLNQAGQAGERLATTTEAVRAHLWSRGADETLRNWLSWWETSGSRQHTVVNGQALLDLGFTPGPRLGEALNAAQRACWNGANPDAQLLAATLLLKRP